MITLKIIGSIFTVFACLQFGMNKTAKAKSRVNVLEKICMALENLSIEIRLGRGELYPIIQKTFSADYIDFSDNRFVISEQFIEKSHLDKLNEMLENLGRSDAKGECEKISVYKSIFAEYLENARQEYKNNRKIWNTLSLGGGVTIVLLII